MSLLTDIVIAILTAYLTFTTSLADVITTILQTNESAVEEVEPSGSILQGLTTLPSRFSNIPDILRKNVVYQQATIIGPDGYTEATTNDPLEAIVNIFCTLTTRDSIRTTTGTGFFIDADGVIMTNAHVAQFLLLEDSDQFEEAECVIRNGNPASARYRAELLYIPPAWVQENAATMNDAVPLGTGERDYALLYASETIDGASLPDMFPALSFDSDLLSVTIRNDDVVAAGYPATDLLANGPATDLIPRAADTSISELYTFGSNYADVLAIRGSIVGAEGASGGPVLNTDGEVIGMIATRGDDIADGAGSLRAITLSHIDRTITEETGFSLEENLSGNLAYRSQVFSATLAPFLLTLLEQ